MLGPNMSSNVMISLVVAGQLVLTPQSVRSPLLMVCRSCSGGGGLALLACIPKLYILISCLQLWSPVPLLLVAQMCLGRIDLCPIP